MKVTSSRSRPQLDNPVKNMQGPGRDKRLPISRIPNLQPFAMFASSPPVTNTLPSTTYTMGSWQTTSGSIWSFSLRLHW